VCVQVVIGYQFDYVEASAEIEQYTSCLLPLSVAYCLPLVCNYASLSALAAVSFASLPLTPPRQQRCCRKTLRCCSCTALPSAWGAWGSLWARQCSQCGQTHTFPHCCH
jgi:hypothetical protein